LTLKESLEKCETITYEVGKMIIIYCNNYKRESFNNVIKNLKQYYNDIDEYIVFK
jgi:hypothetical protein